MPVAVAVAIRYIIMAAVQLGLWSALEKYAIPLINGAIEKVMEAFGVSEETAKDIMANEILQAFESVGVFAITLRTKLPVKVAERLGFTSKGYTKRSLPKAVESKINTGAKTPPRGAPPTSEEIGVVAKAVAKARGLGLVQVTALVVLVGQVIQIPTQVFYALAQYIDFANWQGPYQPYFQKILSIIGIKAPAPMPRARVVSPEIWSRVLATIEELGPRGLSFPFSGVDKLYSRENFADLVDEVAANIVKNGGDASYKNVIGAVLPLVQLGGSPIRTSPSPTAVASAAPIAPSTPSVKVFTGVISSGVVGRGLSFTPRPDDLIESSQELQQAINNNVSSYLAGLLGKVTYEIKVVSSVVVGGIRKSGTAQRVQSGNYADGSPRYKTIVNKFAVADLYLITERGTRSKLTSIVLGPVDALKFNPSAAELAGVAASIPRNIVTSSTDDISTVVSRTNTDVVELLPDNSVPLASAPQYPIVPTPPSVVAPEFYSASNGRGGIIQAKKTEYEDIKRGGNDRYDTYRVILEAERSNALPSLHSSLISWYRALTPEQIEILRKINRGIPAEASPPAPAPSSETTPPAEVTPASALPSGALTAQSLYEFFGALGRQLPSLEDRSRLYEAFGLGPAAFYAGTAEQNTRLLGELKLRGV